jgi:hypothetical protein
MGHFKERAIEVELGRNRVTDCGPVFCEQCGLFFDDKKQNFLNYEKCRKHQNKTGYNLISLLQRAEEKLLQRRRTAWDA